MLRGASGVLRGAYALLCFIVAAQNAGVNWLSRGLYLRQSQERHPA